jgi:hypothetical protein
MIRDKALGLVDRRIKQRSSAKRTEISASAVDHGFETVTTYDMVAG